MPRPKYELPVAGGIATVRDHESEINRVIWELWNAFLLGTLPAGEAEALLDDLRDIRDVAEDAADRAARYGGTQFASRALMLADTAMTYAAGSSTTVQAGSIVRITGSGAAYVVAASGASDQHETTAGGVKLYEAGRIFSTAARASAALARGALAAGDVVMAEGFALRVDPLATGTLSALADRGIAGFSRLERLATPVVATAGDSISARNNLTTLSNDAQGYANWARALSGGAFTNPAAYNVGVGGSTTANLVADQLPQLLAFARSGQISHVLISIGTNDAPSALTYAQTKANIQTVAMSLLRYGVTPIFVVPPPREYAGAVTNFYPRLYRVVQYLEEELPRTVPGVVTVGGYQAFFDPATGKPWRGASPAAGDQLIDGIHFSPRGAYYIGRQLAAYFKGILIPRVLSSMTWQGVYNATDNPNGPLAIPGFNSGAVYAGSDTTYISGVIPSGWTITRGATTATVVSSMPFATVDGDQQLRAWRLVAANTGVNESGAYKLERPIACPPTLAGRQVKLRARVQIANAVSLQFLELEMRRDVDGSAVQAYDMFRVARPAGGFFLFPDGSYDLYLETQALPVADPIGTTSFIATLNFGVAIGGSATITITSVEMVPVAQ